MMSVMLLLLLPLPCCLANCLQPEDVCMVSVMPCTAKKNEAARPEVRGQAETALSFISLLLLLNDSWLPSVP